MLQMDELCAVSTHERDHPRAGCCVRIRARDDTDGHDGVPANFEGTTYGKQHHDS